MQMTLFQESGPIESESTLSHLADTWLADLQRRHPLRRPVSLEWRNLRTTAGLAELKKFRVILSALVLADAEALEKTIKHEYAHLLAVDRHGLRARGHGEAWKQAMRDLGEEPSVFHNYACQRNVSRQVVVYRCAKCESSFERRRRLPRGRKFLHAGCGGEVVLVAIRPL